MRLLRYAPALLVVFTVSLAQQDYPRDLTETRPARVSDEPSWFVELEAKSIAPVDRDNTAQLVDGGTIDTDGFTDLVFSFGGEFKNRVPTSGTMGVVLIPDEELFDQILRTEGQFVFPLEIKVPIRSSTGAIFVSDQQTARVAFPRYRVYYYNETSSAANVVLYVYRTRCSP